MDNINNLSTISEASASFIKQNIASNSNISISSSSQLKKGDYDVYGNIIDYDPDDWLGEDIEQIDIIKSSITKKGSEGVLEVTLINSKGLKDTNIQLTLIDEAYNIHNIYIYYINNYNEKININAGKYRVNNVSLMDSVGGINMIIPSLSEFEINENEHVNLYLTFGEQFVINETIESTVSEIKDVEPLKKSNNILNIILSILILVVMVLIVLFVIKKIKKGDE